MATGYLHGYSRGEQERLHAQARIFEPLIHRDLRFPPRGHVLELGCGAGAQTAILLRRNRDLRVTAVDLSSAHLGAAQAFFRRHPHRRRVNFIQADGGALPFLANSFDGALYVWLLEHVADPLPLLRDTCRVLKPGARLYVREVFNHSVYIRPFCPALEDYWAAYNAQQTALGGNPNVGITLGNLLVAAGYREIRLSPEIIWLDRRTPALRRAWLAYWLELLLSGAGSLLSDRRVTPRLIDRMKREFATLQRTPDAIFHFTPIFGSAAAPATTPGPARPKSRRPLAKGATV